jgi:SOS-response transcriptional repressor LexA
LAEESIETVYPLPRELVGNDELFTLTVFDDLMIEAAIYHGDNGDSIAEPVCYRSTLSILNASDND